MLTHARTRARPGGSTTTVAVALLAVAAGGWVGYLYATRNAGPNAGPNPAAEPPRASADDRIAAPGRLRPEGGVIAVSGPPDDRIAKLYPVEPGSVLKAGEPIAELASRADRSLGLQVARTQLAEAKAAREAAERAGRRLIAAAEADLAQTRGNRAADLEALDARAVALQLRAAAAAGVATRLRDARATGAPVPAAEVDRAERDREEVDAELATAKVAREKVAAAYAEAERAARAKVEAATAALADALARAPLKSFEERVELAALRDEQGVVRAPIAGTVLAVPGREGQPTGAEPILLMARLARMTAVAEVAEGDVARLAERLRDGPVPAEVTSPALTKVLRGVVWGDADVARVVAPAQLPAPGAGAGADRRAVEVIVHLDDASTPAAAQFVGLPVTVAFGPGK
jgi:HlyD family secretion protein